MSRQLKLWGLWFAILILSAYIVPYTLLRDMPKIYGPFLFWGILAIVGIISVGIITSKWKGE